MEGTVFQGSLSIFTSDVGRGEGEGLRVLSAKKQAKRVTTNADKSDELLFNLAIPYTERKRE